MFKCTPFFSFLWVLVGEVQHIYCSFFHLLSLHHLFSYILNHNLPYAMVLKRWCNRYNMGVENAAYGRCRPCPPWLHKDKNNPDTSQYSLRCSRVWHPWDTILRARAMTSSVRCDFPTTFFGKIEKMHIRLWISFSLPLYKLVKVLLLISTSLLEYIHVGKANIDLMNLLWTTFNSSLCKLPNPQLGPHMSTVRLFSLLFLQLSLWSSCNRMQVRWNFCLIILQLIIISCLLEM